LGLHQEELKRGTADILSAGSQAFPACPKPIQAGNSARDPANPEVRATARLLLPFRNAFRYTHVMRASFVLLSSLLLASSCPAAGKQRVTRNWISNDGKSLQAELLDFSASEVKVKLASNFNIVKIPMDRLSEDDKKFVLDLVAKRDKDHSLASGPYASQVTGKFEKGTSKQGLLYQLYGNPKWDGAKRYPLVIWLHGSGGSGNDNQKQMGGATTSFTKSENQSERPCFILAPQCPDAAIGWKKEVADNIMALISDLVDKLPVDDTRLYLTGSSMGGFGTWSLAAKYPKVFACAVPLCGGGDPKSAPSLKDVPIWAFHGDKDDMVPIERDRVVVAALKEIGGNTQFTELTGEGHNITGIVYGKHELHEWMFQQRLKKESE
jgi:predicted esterase